jgi:ubiquinone/menaquinone biosynthesis C-methylase UbiE
MEPHLRREAERAGFSIDLRNRAAEQLDLADACADAVVSTLVLCSVLDVAAALAEIRRVLRPGGRFIFLEHVAAPPGSLLRALQRAARPFSRWTGGNCYPDRETGTAIEAAGFGMLDLESFRLSRFVYGPTIMGTAVR